MQITVPVASETLSALQQLRKLKLQKLEVFTDKTQPNPEPGTLSHSVRLFSEMHIFVVTGQLFFGLARHDIPTLSVTEVGSDNLKIASVTNDENVVLEFGSPALSEIAILWKTDIFAGHSVVWCDGDKIEYAVGIILKVGDTQLVISASVVEPSLTVITSQSDIKKYLLDIDHVGFIL